MKTIEHLLPIRADQALGTSIDVFHKNPEHQRRLLSNPANLPHKAKIKVGDETLDLLATAAYDSEGEYIGPMISWSVITQNVKVFGPLRNSFYLKFSSRGIVCVQCADG